MTEQIKQQVSLFLDDELSPDECEFLVRRLQHDAESRRLYVRYQMIGAAIRGEHINADHALLRSRLQGALTAADGQVAAASRWAPAARRAMQAVAGVGVAAGVALAAIVLLRTGLESPDPGTAGVGAVADQRLERVEPPSYVVPLQIPATPAVTPSVRLTGLQYLMHHGGLASGLNRTVMQAKVLAAENEDIVDLAEEAATQ